MNPVIRLQQGDTHTINIPMADIDGDQLRCRWGANANESGGISQSKGELQSNPCQLTYQATTIGYEGIAIIIEDFDSNNNVLSSIPLQFLIEIVAPSQPDTTTTTTTATISGAYTETTGLDPPTPPPLCVDPPIYDGDWGSGACIGVASNNMTEIKIAARIQCENSSTTIRDILTISPTGMVRSPIIQDPQSNNRYIMTLQWTPRANQYGIHQLCITPVDSSSHSGRTVCFSLLVDVRSPQFVSRSMSPNGVVSQNQSAWIIATDVDIVPPINRNTWAVFFKRDSLGMGNDIEVVRVPMFTAEYQSRQITFRTDNIVWEQVNYSRALIV